MYIIILATITENIYIILKPLKKKSSKRGFTNSNVNINSNY